MYHEVIKDEIAKLRKEFWYKAEELETELTELGLPTSSGVFELAANLVDGKIDMAQFQYFNCKIYELETLAIQASAMNTASKLIFNEGNHND